MNNDKWSTVKYFGNWGGREEVRINKVGRITAKVKEVFTCGQCHALALALHEAAGLPLIGLWPAGERYSDTPDHTVVQLPDGDLLDIGGSNAFSRWNKKRDSEQHPVSKAEVLGYADRDYMEPNLEAARPFALTLLKRLGIAPFTPKE